MPNTYKFTEEIEPAENYEVDCNFCGIRKVTKANRVAIALPQKNIVHGTCATGERKHDDDRYFCRWSCALGFCYYRHGMRKYMNLVRVMASKQGFIGIIPIPPDPTRVLKRNNPCLKGTIEETDAQFHKWIDEGMQVVEQRDSAISSARVFKLHKQQAELRPGRTVLELTDVNNPDLSEEYAITEKEVEGDPTQRLGMYRQHLNAKAKGGSKSKKTNVQSKSKKPASSSKRKSNSGSKKTKSSSSSSKTIQLSKSGMRFQTIF